MLTKLIGYSRISGDQEDLTAQRRELTALGIPQDHVYLDEGLSGTNRERPGLANAFAAVGEGDTFVVTKLSRLARSVPDAREIIEHLTERRVKLSIGGTIHDLNEPVPLLLFELLGMVAEFQADIISVRTREGMQVAKAKGRLRGKQPKLSQRQETQVVTLYKGKQHTTGEIADKFKITTRTVHRIVQRNTPA